MVMASCGLMLVPCGAITAGMNGARWRIGEIMEKRLIERVAGLQDCFLKAIAFLALSAYGEAEADGMLHGVMA